MNERQQEYVENTKKLWEDPAYREKQTKIRQEVHSKLFGKKFQVIGPDGQVHEAENVSKFCREHNIPNRHFRQMLQGKRDMCHGWKRIDFAEKYGEDSLVLTNDPKDILKHKSEVSKRKWQDPEFKEKMLKAKHKRGRDFKLVGPDGKTYEGKEVTAFCKEHNLNVKSVYRVLWKQRFHYKGWYLAAS
jgi:hypothetical protein